MRWAKTRDGVFMAVVVLFAACATVTPSPDLPLLETLKIGVPVCPGQVVTFWIIPDSLATPGTLWPAPPEDAFPWEVTPGVYGYGQRTVCMVDGVETHTLSSWVREHTVEASPVDLGGYSAVWSSTATMTLYVRPAELFADGFETGDLGKWSRFVGDSP